VKILGVYCIDCGCLTDHSVMWFEPPVGVWMGDIHLFQCDNCDLDYVILTNGSQIVTVISEPAREDFIRQAGEQRMGLHDKWRA
jgi:hypothetical protein